MEHVDFSDEFCRFVQVHLPFRGPRGPVERHLVTLVRDVLRALVANEPASVVYALRVLAFGVIIAAIVDKL